MFLKNIVQIYTSGVLFWKSHHKKDHGAIQIYDKEDNGAI